MTLIEAFTSGHLPAVGIFSVPVTDSAGHCVGFYIDHQADQGRLTRQ